MNANIKNNNNYKDSRGEIQMILENCQVGSISRITTEAGNERANHWHKRDGHFIIINEGQIEIYERPINANTKPLKFVLNKGDIHFTGPQVDHTMYMPCYTIFDCYSLLPRNSASYENETVRFSLSLKKIYDEWCD